MANLVIRTKGGDEIVVDKKGNVSQKTPKTTTHKEGNLVIRAADGRTVSIDRKGTVTGSLGTYRQENAVDAWNLTKKKQEHEAQEAYARADMLQKQAAMLQASKSLSAQKNVSLNRTANELSELAKQYPELGVNADAFKRAVNRVVGGNKTEQAIADKYLRQQAIEKATEQATKPTMSVDEINSNLSKSRSTVDDLQARLNAAQSADAYLTENYAFNTSGEYLKNKDLLKQNLGEFKSIGDLKNALKTAKREAELYETEKRKSDYNNELTQKYSAIQTSPQFEGLAARGETMLPEYRSIGEARDMSDVDIANLFINSDKEQREVIKKVYEYSGLLANYEYLSNEEKKTYNAIRAAEGEEAGYEYLEFIEPILLRRGYYVQQAELKDRVNENALNAIFENAGTVLASPMRGVEYLGVLADNAFGLNQDALGSSRDYVMGPTKSSMLVRSETQNNLNTGVGRFVYNTGMSMADNVANLAISGGNEAVSLALMGTGAASQTYYGAKEKGLTNEEALSVSFLSGALEAATEKIGLDNLFDILSKSGKNFVGALVSQMAAEGSEEFLAEIGNRVIDSAVATDRSDYNLAVQRYLDEGYPEEEAKKKATNEFWSGLIEATLSGAFSGGVMGGGANAIATARTQNAEGDALLGEVGSKALLDAAYDATLNASGKEQSKLQRSLDNISKKESPQEYLESKPRKAAKLYENTRNVAGNKFDTIVASLKKSGMDDASANAVAKRIVKDVVNRNSFSADTYQQVLKAYKSESNNAIQTVRAEFDKVNTDYANRLNATVAKPQVAEVAAPVDVAAEVENVQQTDNIREILSEVGNDITKASAIMSIYEAARGGLAKNTAISDTLNAKSLTAEQVNAAYNAGIAARSAQAGAQSISNVKAAKPGVVREYAGKASHTSIRALDAVAKKTGKAVHVVDSIDQIVGFDGRTSAKVYKRIGREGNANAFYNTKTGEYYIALDALDKSYLLVAMHESVHDGAQNNKDGFEKLANITKEVLVKNGYDQAELDNIKDIEEFMCNTVPVILTDRATIDEFVSRIIGADVSTRNAFQRFLDRVYNSILEAYNALKNDPQWSQMEKLRNDLEGIKKMREAYFEMLEGTTEAKTENGITIDPASGAAVFSLKTAPKTDAEVEAAIQRLVDAGFDRASAESWLQSLTSVGGVILQNLESLDYEADERFTWLKKNSDYSQGSVDFNNNCPKRVEFTALFDRLQKEFPDTVFTAEDYETIRQILIRNKIAVTCGPCFVEDRRQHLGEIAQQFIDQMNSGELAPKFKSLLGKDTYVPTQYDLVTYGGAQTLYKEHRGVYNAFIAFNNARGMASARLVEGMAEYNNQIKKWSKRTITSKNNKGGLRIFSLSDADPRIMIDVIQIVIDAAEKGLMIQGYTKKPWFAKMIKDTGIKMLRSHIPLGSGVQLVNGKKMLMFDNVEGINTKDPDYFDSTDYRNIGNNVIGINDPQIQAAMVTDMIDQIIPFHTGLKAEIRNKKKIGNWVNYRNEQTDKVAVTGKKADKQINIYTDVLNAYEKAGKPIKNKREFVQAFLDVCKERGLTPRFSGFLNKDANGDFIYTEGYHKFLVDYKLFDKNGDIILQEPVKPIFDDAYNKKILNDYVKDSGVKVNRDDVYQEIKDEVVGESVKFSEKGTKKTETAATIPTSVGGRSANQRGFSSTHYTMSSTAAADVLGIDNVSNLTDDVKHAIGVLAEIYKSVDQGIPILGFKKPTRAENLEGVLVAMGVLKRRGTGSSAYRYDNGHGLRISNHSAHAENFAGNGEHLSVALFNHNLKKGFESGKPDVIETRFIIEDLNSNPTMLKNLIADIGRFIVSGEYHDTAGASEHKYSGSVQFRREAEIRMHNDKILRENNKDFDPNLSFNSVAILRESTVDRWLRDYASNTNDKYAQAYIAYMSPKAFLKMTTKDVVSRNRIMDETRDMDANELRDATVAQPIQLIIDTETHTVIGHEGRHRMVALMFADINRVPVLLFDFDNKYSKSDLKDFTLRGQYDGVEITTIESAIPLNYGNKELVVENFATQPKMQEISERMLKKQTFRFSSKTPKNYRTDAEILKTAKGTTEAEKNALSLYNLNRESLAQRTSNLLMLQEQLETAKGKDKSALAAQIRRMENDVQEFEARMNKLREKQELQDVLIRERISAWGDFLSEFGTIDKGEQAEGTEPNREIDVPAALNKTSKVSKYARTILEAKTIPDEMIDPIRAKILEGGMSYIPESNASVMAVAMARTEGNNISNAWEIWDAAVRGEIKKVDSSITALGEALLKRTAESGDAKQTVILAAELTEMFSRAGKVLQSAKLLKRMGVAGQIAYLDRTVASINRSIAKRGSKIASQYHVTIDENLMNDLLGAKTEEDQDVAMAKIYQNIADQMPNTWVDRWNAWRYLAMLGNPLTHIRNVVGNAMFVPAVTAKNVAATLYEKMALAMGGKFTPTKAIIVDKQYDQFAKNDFENVKNELTGGGKYNDIDEIRAKQKVFKSKALEAVRNLNFELLEREDGRFLRRHYRTALGQYLKANKIDLTMMSEETLGKARAYAIMEAQKATYRNASKLATALQQAGNNSKIMKFVLDSVVPFKKTPINILKQGINYSPIGFITTMGKGLDSVIKKGNTGAGTMTMSEFIDGMAAGTVGTAAVALGYYFASLGALVGGLGDDDEDKLRKLTGEQGYAIKIGDHTYTISWAAPISLPFLVGAALYDTVNEKREWDTSTVFEALSLITEPMVTLSMLDGIQSMLESAAMAKKEERLSKLSEAAISSYVSQPFPTALAQIARIIDPNQRSMYVDKTNKIPDGIERIGQSIMKKIPGLTKLIMASRNEWGEERTSGIGERLVENLVSPGYYSKVEYNAVEAELARLLDATGDGAIVPDTPAKKINDMDLTREEYEAYVALIGQPSLNLLSELIKTDGYKAMADDEKAAAIKYAHTYVKELAKYGVKPEIGEPADWIMQLSNSSGDVAATAQGILDHTQEQYIGTKQKDAFWSAIDANDMDSAKAYIDEQRAAGKDDYSIWQSVQSKYKEKYIDLVSADNTAEADALAKKLKELGLKNKEGEAYASNKTFKKWQFELESGFSWDNRYDSYKNGEITAADLKKQLMNVEGYTADEARNKIAQLDYQKAHPDTYVDDAWVAEYYNDVQGSGMSIDTFISYRSKVKGISGEGKKEKRMEVINSMPISAAQKDALYFAEGWAESKLKEAPWH